MIIVVSLLVVVGAGCGDEADGGHVQGVYKISGWTFNEGACNVEGAEIPVWPEMLYVKFSQAPSPRMTASLCYDPADCGQLMRSLSTNPFAWTLKPAGENAWQGKIVDYRPLDNESCVGNQVDLLATTTEDGQIRIEMRHHAEAEFAMQSCKPSLNSAEPDVCLGGYCNAADARLATQDRACSAYEVILGNDFTEILSNAPASQENSVASSEETSMK
jgi:hypothetical protein